MAAINHEAALARAGANVTGWWSRTLFFARRYPLDFKTLNFRTMTDPASWFTTTFILTKVRLDGEKAVGTLTMVGDTLQTRIDGGESEVLLLCNSEEDRIGALEKWFDVVLTSGEKDAIKGTAAEIKA